MAKHPVPKKKTSKARTSRRYKSFRNRAQARLARAIQLVKCPSCGDVRQQHAFCKTCGSYRGKNCRKNLESHVQTPKSAEVKTIKAE